MIRVPAVFPLINSVWSLADLLNDNLINKQQANLLEILEPLYKK